MIDLVVAAGTARFGASPVTARVAGINKVAVCACRHIVRRIDFRTGFANALVADAFLVASAIAVGSAVSRNRRTNVTRAVGSRLVRRNGGLAFAARRRVSHIRTAFLHALCPRQFIVVNTRRARAGFFG